MNVSDQVMEVLRRHAPGLLVTPAEDSIERRRQLRAELAEIEAKDLARVKECEAKVQAIESRQAQLRAEQEAAEGDCIRARGDLSDARSIYSSRRDAVWKALESIPSAELASFQREVEGRLEGVATLDRSWPGKLNKQIGRTVSEGNRDSVDAYAQALLHTRSLVTNAIHAGLEGAEADAAISEMRSKWPRVQVGPNEHIVPSWPA